MGEFSMLHLSRPIICTLAALALLPTSHPLLCVPPAADLKGPDWGSDAFPKTPHATAASIAPPATVPKGPDWGSDAIPKTPHATAASVAPAATGPDWGSDMITRSIAASAPATRIALTPTAIVCKNHEPAVISEPSLLAVFGNDLWDLRTMTRVGPGFSFPRTTDRLTTVMSADGKFVVVAPFHGRRDATSVDVTVYDTATGAKVSDVLSALREDDLDYVGLAKSPWMLIASRGLPFGESPMELWNFQTGKIIRRFNCCYRDAERTVLSPDGKFVAMANDETIKIYNLETSEAVATMETPAGDIHAGVEINATPDSVRVRAVAMSSLSIACLAFSPDGTELAGLSAPFGGDEARLICWDAKGKVKDDFVFGGCRRLFPADPGMLQWSPDGSAWMIKGRWLLDRKFKRVVFGSEGLWAENIVGAFIDPQHYFVAHPLSNARSEVLDLPREALRKSIAVATDAKAPAILRPGQSITLQLALENARGDPASTRQAILDAVTARLKRDHIAVAENQDTVLSLTLKEGIGDHARRGAVVARGILEYKILVHDKDGKDKEYFSESIAQQGDDSQSTTADQNRAEMLRIFQMDIAEMDLPYFIPAQPGLVALPFGHSNRHERPGFLLPDPNLPKAP
jgi:hypothetical protein